MCEPREHQEFPELRALPAFGAAWYRLWRLLHLAKYPDVDRGTRDNLDMFVDIAETRERSLAAGGPIGRADGGRA